VAEKVTIFAWHMSTKELNAIRSAGYKHNAVLTDVDEFRIARELFERGVNITLSKGVHGEVMVGVADDFFKVQA
jgi:hypothetical protein